MPKVIIGVVVGLIAGLAIGAGAMHLKLMPQLLSLDTELAETRREMAALRTNDGDSARLARLEAERTDYDAKLSALREELDTLRKRSSVAPADIELAEDITEINASAEEQATEPPSEERREREGRRGRWGGDATPEEREARRQEFVTRMQDNLTQFFTGELNKSGSPATQERLIALENQIHDMMELRMQMRNAETDEERQALEQAFGETMTAARDTMKEQQREMVDSLADQFNIKGKENRQAFQQALEAAVDSPFFSDNPSAIMFGGGGGRNSGGRGPGGGGGRR